MRRIPGWFWCGLWGVACASSGGNDGDLSSFDVLGPDTGEVSDEGRGDSGAVETLPSPGGCGLEPYSWKAPPEVGRLVSWEEDPMWAQPREVLEGAMIGAGFGAMAPLDFGTRVYRMRYVTQDRGESVEATALVAVPQPEDGGPGTYPLLLSFHWTTGMNDSCAPSRSIEGTSLVAIWASAGFITVAPDYLGMNGFGEPSGRLHPYLVGEPTAIAAWDALRAAEELLGGPIPDEPARPASRRVVLWGASQGGHGALWGHRLARWVAPEYEVVTVVASTPPADLVVETRQAILEDRAGLPNVAAFLVGAADWYRRNEALGDVFSDRDPGRFRTSFPEAVRQRCDFWTPLEGASSRDVFQPTFLDALRREDLPVPWDCFLAGNSLNRTRVPPGSPVPILFVLAQNDSLVNTAAERQAFLDLCQQGESLVMVECQGASHQQGSLWSLGEQKQWMLDRLQGIAPEGVCQLQSPVRCLGTP